jgi:hypothetical protein
MDGLNICVPGLCVVRAQDHDCVFEFIKNKFYVKGKNPGVGPTVGTIVDSTSRNSEVLVEFFDGTEDWIDVTRLRKAPKPGWLHSV